MCAPEVSQSAGYLGLHESVDSVTSGRPGAILNMFRNVKVTFGYRVFRHRDELSRGCQVRCQGIC